jgi:hypothetical protein
MNVLPVSTYPYTALSAVYPYDESISFNPYFQQFNNGFFFFSHNVFKSVNDLSFNRYTGFYLTDKFKNEQIIKNVKINKKESFSNSFLNLYMFSNLSYASIGQPEGPNQTQYLYADKFQVSDSTVFQVIKDEVEQKIWFIYNKAYYVQAEDKPPWRLKLYYNGGEAPPPELEDSYKFKYYRYGENFLIYTNYGSTGVLTRFLKSSLSEKYLGFFGTTLMDQGIQIGFNFLDFNFTPAVTLNGLNEKSWFYSYYNRPVNFEENFNVNPNLTKSVSGIKQNFLVSVPYQTKISDVSLPEELGGDFKVSSFNLDLMSLKNIKNSNYQYSKLPYNLDIDDNFDEVDDADKESEFNKRDYLKIFTGSNQEYGFEKPLMSYSVNNKKIIFKKDETTFFHYPSTAPTILLNESGLKEAGATPSTIPFFADKIFKKDAQYGKHIYWGDSTQFQNGQWLCSWLSGSNENGVWMDRWYLPDEISAFAALTAYLPEPISCGINYANFNNIKVFDSKSIMTLEPEVWYKYFHVGESFVKYSVDEIVNFDEKYLTVHYDNWRLSSISDNTSFKNNALFINFSDSFSDSINELKDNVADLNGSDQYVLIPYSNTLKYKNSNTFSIWAYSDDWEKVKSSDIVSNGNGNYFNLKISNGLQVPIHAMFGKDTNTITLFNNDNLVYNYVKLISYSNPTNINSICLDDNFNVWTLDNANNVLYKINYNGSIENKINFPPSFNLSNLTINSKGEIFVLNTNTGNLSGFDLNFTTVSTINTNYLGGDYYIECNLTDAISGVRASKLLFDSKNYPWILSTDKKVLNRFETPVLQAEYMVDDFCIDNLDNIWVLFDKNKIYRLDQIGSLTLSAVLPIKNLDSEAGKITIINDFYQKTDTDENFVIINKNKSLYKYDSKLNFVKRYNSAVIPYENNYVNTFGDWSGYNYNRKYIYFKNFNGSKNLQLNYTLFNNQLGIKDYSLFTPIKKLNKGWHLFNGVYDNDQNKIYFYIDGELEGRVLSTIPNTVMYLNLNNSMLLGNKMGVINSLSDELVLKNKFTFKGKIDDFRVYNKPLNELEIKLLYYLKKKFYDINWHIPTGFQIYVEEIERFFKHKMPGSKSNHFNINISNSNISDLEVRGQIESVIKNTVQKIAPAYTQLYKINWTD